MNNFFDESESFRMFRQALDNRGRTVKPHSYKYPADKDFKVGCKFCSAKIVFPFTPEQWEVALYGPMFRLGCPARNKATV